MSKDAWETPKDLYNILDKGGEYMGIRFGGFYFDVDLCATHNNTKCSVFYTDYLNNIISYLIRDILKLKRASWYSKAGTAFMNPPYSNPKPFIQKAWEDSKHFKIVCLVKCDPSTQWWATFWDYNQGKPKLGCEVRFFPKRIKFDPPSAWVESGKVWYEKGWMTRGQDGKEKPLPGPSFPSALVIMDRRD